MDAPHDANSRGFPTDLGAPAEPVLDAGDVLGPLSHGQRALWFLQQLAPDSQAYIITRAVRFPAPVDVDAMQRAFQGLVDRHACLRTTFHAPQGEPLQRVHAHMAADFRRIDASGWSAAELEARASEEAWRPFDLERGPLLRVLVFTCAPDDHVLVLSAHHIISDLWSVALLIYEIGQLYAAEAEGKPPALRRLKMEYLDYCSAQAEMLAGAKGEALWDYWRSQLAGRLAPLELPTDRPRPPLQSFRGAWQWMRIGSDLTNALRALSRAHEATLLMTSLAAFQVLLYRYSGQESFTIGSPAAGRSARSASLIGYFVNPVVLRADLSGNPTFAELLGRVRETVQGAFAHDEYPFPLLVERLQPARDPSRSPLFQVMFTWQKTTSLVDGNNMASFSLGDKGGTMDVAGLPMQSLPLQQRISQFDMTLQMAEAGEELAVSLEYNTDLFDAATIRRLLRQFETLLRSIVADPEQVVATLSLSDAAEQRRLRVAWNQTATGDPLPAGWGAAQLVEQQVCRAPGALAVTLDGQRFTYGELNERAGRAQGWGDLPAVGPQLPARAPGLYAPGCPSPAARDRGSPARRVAA